MTGARQPETEWDHRLLDDPEVMPRLARIDTWPDAQWIDAFRARYRYLWAAQGPKVALEAMAKRIDAADGEARVREVAAAWVALVQVVGARRAARPSRTRAGSRAARRGGPTRRSTAGTPTRRTRTTACAAPTCRACRRPTTSWTR